MRKIFHDFSEMLSSPNFRATPTANADTNGSMKGIKSDITKSASESLSPPINMPFATAACISF